MIGHRVIGHRVIGHRVIGNRVVGVWLAIAAAAGPAAAQSAAGRVTIAPQVTWLQLADLDATSVGIGGRIVVDLTRWIAIDGSVDVFPNDDFTLGGSLSGLTYKRRRIDGFAGVRAGVRGERVGGFARLRPGFTHLTDRGIECGGSVCPFVLIAPANYGTEFALDLGGTVEFYPTDRTVARVDLGDVMIRHRAFTPPCTGCSTHNFTTSFGFGLRF